MVKQSENPNYTLAEATGGSVILPATYSWLDNSAANQSNGIATYKADDADYNTVRKLITVDERIGDGHSSVTEQRGFGGHCFPKDTQAIVNTAKEKDIDLSILNEAIKYNNKIRKD